MFEAGKVVFGSSWAGAVVALIGLLAPAQAQAPFGAGSPAPAAILGAAATVPSVTPATGAPGSQSGLAQPAKPAALQPSAAPMTPAPVACRAPSQLSHLDHPLLHTARRLANGKTLVIVAIGSSSTASRGELAGRKLSQPPCHRAQKAPPGA